ncbi:MAG: hypothetical protein ACKOJF_10725, partial [Planctomycetaceae bacterium]
FITAPDWETPLDVGGDNVYNVTVRVQDSPLASKLTSDFAYVVTVTNVNPGTPIIETANTLSVDENVQNVVVFSATDADGQALTFSIVPVAQGGAADAAFFEFTGTPSYDSANKRTTQQLRFVNSAGLDYETYTNRVFQVTVKAADGVSGGEIQSATTVLSVSLNPVNESAPSWTTAATQTVTENNASGLTSVA